VAMLDSGLAHLGGLLARAGRDVENLPGAGAAGGMGAGIAAFLGGELRSGIRIILDALEFDRLARDADLILTGEGRFDHQSLGGKVISGLADRAGGIPLVVIPGCALPTDLTGSGVTAVFPILRQVLPLEQTLAASRENLAETVGNVLRLWKAFGENAQKMVVKL